MSSQAVAPAPAPAPPLDNEDLLSLILLRLPPLPSSLSRASHVCTRWRRLVRDPFFLRRFREFHRTPPVLGFFHNSPHFARFVAAQGQGPAGTPIAAAVRDDLRRDGDDGMWWFVDCRHGRALLRARDWSHLLVWDPLTATAGRREVAVPNQVRAGASDCNAAVLCPSAATGGCHFDVAVVFVRQRRALACVYSSRTAAWGERVSIPVPSSPQCELSEEPGALVGGALYWLLGESSILEFRVGDRRLALVDRPPETFSVYKRNIRVVRSEGGELGLVAVKNFSLHFWAREADFDGWVLRREIELGKLLELPLTQPRVGSIPVWISGIGEDGNVVFLRTMVGIFMVWPETMQFKMITNNVLIKTVYPYATFYVPEEGKNFNSPFRIQDPRAPKARNLRPVLAPSGAHPHPSSRPHPGPPVLGHRRRPPGVLQQLASPFLGRRLTLLLSPVLSPTATSGARSRAAVGRPRSISALP